MKQVATLGSFEISESGNQDISESDKRLVLQSNMCRLDNGTMCILAMFTAGFLPAHQAQTTRIQTPLSRQRGRAAAAVA
ncbi:hypothetical protein ZWY2020_057827 [Hordeum vulgare]|nr:hypothetical protein ZWY2020_057827 [Hordeum vulgare]